MSSEVLLAIWDDVEQPPSVVDFAPDWIEPFVPMRSRVIRDVEYVGLELPDVESLTAEPVEADLHRDLDLTDDSDQSADTANSGAAAIAWAVAYRDGLEQGRRDGLASGYAEGTREGFAAAREEGRLAVEQTINAMSAQVDEILTALDRTAAAVATDATSLGLGVAEAVLDHELRTSADPGAEAIARAARLVPDTSSNGADQLMVRLNPLDVERLGDIESAGLAGRQVDIVADPAVASGSCVMELGATRLDASIDAALARVRAVLSC